MSDHRLAFVISSDCSEGILSWFGFVVKKLLSIRSAIEIEFEILILIEYSQLLLP